MSTIFLSLFALLPLFFIRLITVQCERTAADETRETGVCQVRERGVVGSRALRYSLRDIKAIRVDEHVDSDGDRLSRLVLDTENGDVPLGHSENVDVSARRNLVARFDEFRQGSARSFEMTIGYGGIGFALFWWFVCGFGVAATRGRTVRVVIDAQRGAILTRRWFRTIHLPLSREVRIVSGKDSDGDETWQLVAPGRSIPLPQRVRPEDVLAFHDAVRAATDDAR